MRNILQDVIYKHSVFYKPKGQNTTGLHLNK